MSLLTLGVGSGKQSKGATGISAYTDVAGLYLWVEAKKEAFANNDPVGTMTDWSARANTLTQATGAAKPTFLTGEINSQPAFSFDGGDYVAKAAAAGIGSSAFTAFSVIKRVSTASRRTVYYIGDATNAGRQILIDTSEKFRLTKSQIAEIAPSTTVVSNSAYELWTVTYDGSTYTFYRNGTSDATGSASQTFTDTVPVIYVGINSGLAENGNMKLALGLVYDSVLTGTQLTNVNTLINATYALF